jgi:hypothetical protein
MENNGGYMDGYLSDVYFIDGQALTPSSFGETNSDGVWVPKAYTGTYGNNGFHLDFKDAALTAGSNVGLGKDVSGNGNYWTTNNISVTAGVTYDSMVDTPTNNYATLNPLDYGTGSLGEGNLNFGATATRISRSTQALPASGKWYWEVLISAVGNSSQVGIAGPVSSLTAYLGAGSDGYSYASNALRYNNGSSVAYGATYTTNDLIGVAYDSGTGELTFYKNNATQGVAYSSLSGTLFPAVGYGSGTGTGSYHINFGQRPFTYTPPAGFKALCTANLPAVAIPKPSKHFNAKTRTGTGASFNVTGQAFQPDFAWTKGRSGATDHALYDTVRGVQKQMESNTTSTETTEAQGVTAFNSDGYSGGTLAQMNTNTATYIDWMWKAGGAPTTNNVAGAGNVPTAGSVKIDGADYGSALAGSIAALRLSANTVAGFSVVIWDAVNNGTVAHGLGAVPKLIIRMDRSVSHNHPVYHASMNATPQNGALYLTLTNAYAVDSTAWNNTAPTTTTFSTGTDVAAGDDCVAFCWAEIPGYSKFGSYVGNGSTDGPFVYCGLRPKYVLIKRTDTGGAGFDWFIWDTARNTYNQMASNLTADQSVAEGVTAYPLDATANGFKLRNTATAYNASGGTYIFAAFAEHPFGGSNVSPSPAR